MLSLLAKDLVAARWFLLAAFPLYVVQVATFQVSPPGAMIVTLIFTGLFAFGSLGIEEAQGTEATWCSLPVSRRQIVVARYLTTTIGIVLGLGTSWAVSRGTLGLPAQAGAFFLLLTAASLFLPGYFRFGMGKGLMLFAMLVLAALVAMAAIAFVVDGALLSEPPDERRIAAAGAWIEDVRWLLAGLLIAVALVGAAVSALLSAHWYRARDC